MTDRELIQALREDAEWAAANEWETPITLSDNLAEAAKRIEALVAENEHLREVTKMLGKDTDVPTKWVSVEERLPECSKGRICPSCHKKRLSRYAKERKLNEIGANAYSEQCALRRAERGERKGGQAPQREDV